MFRKLRFQMIADIQVLFLFSVIGNTPSVGRYVFRYKNQEARLNFNERVVVHRGLFKGIRPTNPG